jgi:hypothetical protein
MGGVDVKHDVVGGGQLHSGIVGAIDGGIVRDLLQLRGPDGPQVVDGAAVLGGCAVAQRLGGDARPDAAL